MEIYFCVHGETCCYSNFSAHTFFSSLLSQAFQNPRVPPYLSLQDHPACCLFHLSAPAARGRIPAYASHCPLLLGIVFKERFRLPTSTGQSFQSGISIYNKASYPTFVKSVSNQVENEASCLLPLSTGRDVSSRDLDQRSISRYYCARVLFPSSRAPGIIKPLKAATETASQEVVADEPSSLAGQSALPVATLPRKTPTESPPNPKHRS